MKEFNNNCNQKICSTQSSTISWTTPANIVKAGFAHPYEMIVPDQLYCIKGLESLGVNSINPKCGHCGCSDSLLIHGNTDICGNVTISGQLTIGGAKTFVIPHPEYKDKYLRHVCIEAPTRGTNIYEYQFTVGADNQKTNIELPSYFSLLNERPRVYISAVNVFSHAYGNVNKERTHALIHTEKAGTFNILVTGVRKDPMAVRYSNGKRMMDEPILFKDIPANTQLNR